MRSEPASSYICKGIIYYLANHPSILKIKQKIQVKVTLFFKIVLEDFVRKVVKKLTSDNVAAEENPINVLKSDDFCF